MDIQTTNHDERSPRTLRLRPSAIAAVFGLALIAACGRSPNDTCDETSSCTSSGGPDGGDANAGDGPGIDAPAGCDLTKGPQESAACVADSVGIFVSPSGDDAATGRQASPVKTIGKGAQLAKAQGLPRVYVCEGSYDTAAEITSPISIYGGLSCAWAYTGAKPKLAPAKGIALKVTSVSGAVLVQDLEVDGAADPSTPGDSAIAAFVAQSTAVTFTNVTLSAGAGTPGATGATRSNYTGDTAAAGGMFVGTNGGAGGSALCADGTKSQGGGGGDKTGAGLGDGTSMPAVGSPNSGATKATSCDPGTAGAGGLAAGTVSASSFAGAVDATGWSTANSPANDAPNGNPAQGGGGGGTKLDTMGPGGGGGSGGCGGAGGATGQPGGSSFAILSFQSTVTLSGSGSLTSAAGGTGGTGGTGQKGQAGGAAGAGVACNGGMGGAGAGGSGGSGGAGGYSVPVAYVGTPPQTGAVTLTPGTPGVGGDAGSAGVGPGNPGPAGVKGAEGKAAQTLSLGQ